MLQEKVKMYAALGVKVFHKVERRTRQPARVVMASTVLEV